MFRGVSMFAMLTGTLPFTVEPFNIKQLHQKMVNGEISAIPSDISKGSTPTHRQHVCTGSYQVLCLFVLLHWQKFVLKYVTSMFIYMTKIPPKFI